MVELRFNWDNLRQNKCPKDNKMLWPGDTGILKCSNRSCDFKITEVRMGELCISMNKQALDRSSYAGEGMEDLQKAF